MLYKEYHYNDEYLTPDIFPPEVRLFYSVIIAAFEEAKGSNDFSWFNESSRSFKDVCGYANIDYKRVLKAIGKKKHGKYWGKNHYHINF